MKGSDSIVFRTHGSSKSYKDVTALKPIDLYVPRHSIFAFLGPKALERPQRSSCSWA